jgi:hypothetical protein
VMIHCLITADSNRPWVGTLYRIFEIILPNDPRIRTGFSFFSMVLEISFLSTF